MSDRSDDVYDELLVLRAQSGEAAALGELVGRWNRRLIAYARRIIGPDGAADATQEAWVSIVRGLGGLSDPARFRVWAYRIVTRRCRDWQRRRVQQRRRPPVAEADAGDGGRPAETRLVRDAVDALPADQRTVVWLRYRGELSVAEIGHVLGIPAGTVKSRLHHAREQLKQTLERAVGAPIERET